MARVCDKFMLKIYVNVKRDDPADFPAVRNKCIFSLKGDTPDTKDLTEIVKEAILK